LADVDNFWPNYNFYISQGSVEPVLGWGGWN